MNPEHQLAMYYQGSFPWFVVQGRLEWNLGLQKGVRSTSLQALGGPSKLPWLLLHGVAILPSTVKPYRVLGFISKEVATLPNQAARRPGR